VARRPTSATWLARSRTLARRSLCVPKFATSDEDRSRPRSERAVGGSFNADDAAMSPSKRMFGARLKNDDALVFVEPVEIDEAPAKAREYVVRNPEKRWFQELLTAASMPVVKSRSCALVDFIVPRL